MHLHNAGYLTDLLLKGFNIVEELKFFLQHKFLYWLEAHSCMQTEQDSPCAMLPLFLEWAMVGETWFKFIDGELMLFTVYRR